MPGRRSGARSAHGGSRADDAASWPALAEIDHLTGEPFTATGTTPALTAAYDQLIGPGRWTRQVDPGRAVVVRFPSEDRVNVGYHVEGSFSGPGGHWANVRSATAACWRSSYSPTSGRATRPPG